VKDKIEDILLDYFNIKRHREILRRFFLVEQVCGIMFNANFFK